MIFEEKFVSQFFMIEQRRFLFFSPPRNSNIFLLKTSKTLKNSSNDSSNSEINSNFRLHLFSVIQILKQPYCWFFVTKLSSVFVLSHMVWISLPLMFSFLFVSTCGIHVFDFLKTHTDVTKVSWWSRQIFLSRFKEFFNNEIIPLRHFSGLEKSYMHFYNAHPQANLNTFHLLILIYSLLYFFLFMILHDLLWPNKNIDDVCGL